jgi:2-methylcitrate dehydratase PrpD
VRTIDGRTFAARVDVPKGDPGNPLTRAELEAKAIRLARFRGGATEEEMRAAIVRIWRFDTEAQVGKLVS